MESNKATLEEYLSRLNIDASNVSQDQAETVFESLIIDYQNKKISEIELGDITGDLFYGHKVSIEIEKNKPELANLMTFISEISWDKDNLPERYKNTLKKVAVYADQNKLG